MLTDYQINAIASSISSLDVIEYLNNHKKEYQKFLDYGNKYGWD